MCLGLWIRLAQTLPASQLVLAWTFLMMADHHAIIQKLHTYHYSWAICLPKTSFSSRFKRRRMSKLMADELRSVLSVSLCSTSAVAALGALTA